MKDTTIYVITIDTLAGRRILSISGTNNKHGNQHHRNYCERNTLQLRSCSLSRLHKDNIKPCLSRLVDGLELPVQLKRVHDSRYVPS